MSYLFVPPGLCNILRRSKCRRSNCRRSKCRTCLYLQTIALYGVGAFVVAAYVTGAYFVRANVAGAYVAGAFVAGANVARATVAGANVAGAFVAEHSSHFSEHLSSEHLSPEHMSCHLHNYTSRSSYILNLTLMLEWCRTYSILRSASFFGKIVVIMATLCLTNTKTCLAHLNVIIISPKFANIPLFSNENSDFHISRRCFYISRQN